ALLIQTEIQRRLLVGKDPDIQPRRRKPSGIGESVRANAQQSAGYRRTAARKNVRFWNARQDPSRDCELTGRHLFSAEKPGGGLLACRNANYKRELLVGVAPGPGERQVLTAVDRATQAARIGPSNRGWEAQHPLERPKPLHAVPVIDGIVAGRDEFRVPL